MYYLLDVLSCQPISVVETTWKLGINDTMLFLFFLSPRVSAGPQKPQTASKKKYEKFGPKIQIPH